MEDIRIGMWIKCREDGCKGKMKAVSGGGITVPAHTWVCNVKPVEHTQSIPDADIPEEDLLPKD